MAIDADRVPHIKVWRSFYWHHGIDLGDGTVIHFTGEPGRRLDAAVRRTSREAFLRGGELHVVRHRDPLPVDEVVARASGCLGRTGYSVIWTNCEHFARWCAVGRHESRQVRDAVTGTVALSLTGSVVGALARRHGLLLLGRALPLLGPLGVGLLVAGVASSFLYGESPFDEGELPLGESGGGI